VTRRLKLVAIVHDHFRTLVPEDPTVFV